MKKTCFMGRGLFSVPALFWRQIMDEAKIFSDAEMLKLAMPNMKSPYLLREYSLASMGRISMKTAFGIDWGDVLNGLL